MKSNDLVSIDELDWVTEGMLKASRGVKIWLFFGEVGAGKTTIIKCLCSHLGVKECVSSPTFALIHEYAGFHNAKIYHFDFYRLKTLSEAYDIGIEEYFDSGSHCFIEWPAIVENILPKNHFNINIKISSYVSSKRIIDYKLIIS